MTSMCHFLLAYDHDLQKLIEQDEFADGVVAARAYTKMERVYRGQSRFEIVLVGADNIETIMKTHGHYFAASDASQFLAGI